MGLIRSLITLVVVGFLVIVGATVPLGDKTFFGHVRQIWSAEETQDLVEAVKEKSGPMVERVKRGVEAGVREAKETPDPKATPEAENSDPAL